MKSRIVFVAAASSFVLAAVPVFAGFTAVTTTDTVLTPGVAGQPPMVGEAFSTESSGGFSSYTPDTSADPQISTDLSSFKYDLAGTVASVDLMTGVVDYTGTYEIYYDALGTGVYVPGTDPSVSTGTFTLAATFGAGTNDASLAGELDQTAGPTGPGASSFADLSEGGHPVDYTGTYDGTDPDVSGTIQGTLRQNASVPEPASLALLGAGALGLVVRRRQGRTR
jgi:hypothetical protein